MTSHTIRAAFAAAAVILLPTVALAADDVPDITGTWTGKTYTIVAGKGGHWPQNMGTFEKPGLFEKDLKITLTGQDGRRFWGTVTITADGGPTDEPFIGEFVPGSERVVIADTDGYFDGRFEGDGFSFCYAHAGGESHTSVVSCTEVKRRR
ncbi:MAG: hypothetical protein KDJ86_03865 [Bauldia sp.]|uniref:hypothetical protein n=1 Tax=Bauldia sp. TaxID=2575872 RepID=UPI001D828384|nr:hypothetical protein [Bauldia sp.]MCB1494900.1 hypothetical protein [Bauldia sp.]